MSEKSKDQLIQEYRETWAAFARAVRARRDAEEEVLQAAKAQQAYMGEEWDSHCIHTNNAVLLLLKAEKLERDAADARAYAYELVKDFDLSAHLYE